MSTRFQKQQPWYHEILPRCDTETLGGDQCKLTARRKVVGKDLYLCTTHAKMSDEPTHPIRLRKLNF